ncbi:MAG: hypothetical protein K5643_05125, partial [Saccharofermentans sp.]|nr:hypothetical protein [Saccharofermentans sp.]
ADNNSILSRTTYEYDAQGNPTKTTVYTPTGDIEWWSETEYSAAGKQARFTRYFSDGKVYFYNECDPAGNEIKTVGYTADGSFDWHNESVYDEQGRLIKTTYYAENGDVRGWDGYSYK